MVCPSCAHIFTIKEGIPNMVSLARQAPVSELQPDSGIEICVLLCDRVR